MVDPNQEYKLNLNKKLAKALQKEEKTFSGFFVKNFRFTYILVLAIFFLGIYSLLILPREANPEVKIPLGAVTTFFPGASPSDVEELVTNKIESKVKNLENLNRFTSNSGQGISLIYAEFDASADIKESLNRLREAVDEARPDLPQEAETPFVSDINISDIPIITYSLVCDRPLCELKRFADIINDNFENINNVSKVILLGGLEREFQIIVEQTKLANYNLSLSQIISAVSRANISRPAGSIKIEEFKYNIRVDGKFDNIEDINRLVIATYNGSPVYLRDVAQVIDGFKSQATESKIGFKNQDSKSTISIQIYKKTGGNILSMVEESKKIIENLKNKGEIPEDVLVQITNDNSAFIKEDLGRLGASGAQTMFLITFILFMVLSFRGALITGFSIPLAFLIAFVLLYLQGLTLNSIVLFSLVLSLGLMVDNSIIIIEGINEYISKHQKKPYQAALLSVWNFKWPIISGTMTTVSAFLPLLLVSGILGEFIGIIPKTITAALLSSLFVALVILPTFASRFIKIKISGDKIISRDKKRHLYINQAIDLLRIKYDRLLRKIIVSKKKRRSLIAGAFAAFLLAIMVPATGLMKIEMFPKIDIDYFIVNIKLPAGSTLEKTKIIAAETEKIISAIPELDNYVVNLGTSASLGISNGGSDNSHLANITVNLVGKKERTLKSYEIAEKLRPELKKITGAIITVEELSAGPPAGSPIEVGIYGQDLSILNNLSDEITAYFKTIPGVVNVKDSWQESTGDLTFTIDKEKADYFGLDASIIANSLRSAVFGAKASYITLADEDIDIIVKYDEDKFTDIKDLENISLVGAGGRTVILKQVAEISLKPSFLSINHRDGERIITVTADTEKEVNLRKIFADFEQKISELNLPEGYTVKIGGELEDIAKSYRETFLSMILAIILISFILILQFNSFRQPLIIIFTLPLAIIGVIFGLNLLGLAFSFTAFIGIVALSGVVVNNSIILIDQINKNINNGLNFIEAIIEGGKSRMQPILLTSLTTIVGILPLYFADALWQGLSAALIFGLLFSTFFTLFMVPVMYAGICQKEKCLNK